MSLRNKGFTLIELMLAIVIYGIVMVTVLGAFWNLVQTRERADHFRNLQKELHFVMVRLADKVRAQSVDYDRGYNGSPIFAPCISLPCTSPSIETKHFGLLGSRLRGPSFLSFEEEQNSGSPSEQRDDSLTEYNVLVDGIPLLSSKVQLIPPDPSNPGKYKNIFVVYPGVDPFDNLASAETQIQPRVEIFLSIQDTTYPDLQLSVKTTVSSRRYGE